MESKSIFNKKNLATMVLQQIIYECKHSASVENDTSMHIDSESVENACMRLLNFTHNKENKKIIENCKDLFINDSTKNKVAFEIDAIHAEMKKNEERNASPLEIAKWLIQCFPEEISGVPKRTYDMSKIASNGMLTIVKTPDGETKKAVQYESYEEVMKKIKQKNSQKNLTNEESSIPPPPQISTKDKYGNPIHIQLMGYLFYRTPSSPESICKFSITRTIDADTQEQFEVFSNFSIREMKSNKEYHYLVVNELLSEKNVKLSNADNYIGEIEKTSFFKPGFEKTENGIRTYQMSRNYALTFNGERIEAIRTNNQQESIKEISPKNSLNSKNKSDEEPEL